MDTYRQMPVWQKAMELAALVYQRTGRFPEQEQMGIAAQLRHTALALPYQLAVSPMDSAAAFQQGLKRVRRLLKQLEIEVLLADHLHCWRSSQLEQLRSQMEELDRLVDAFFPAGKR